MTSSSNCDKKIMIYLRPSNSLFSVRLQITELLDDERCEAECEELPQDGEEGPASPDSSQHTETDSSVSARYGLLFFICSKVDSSCQPRRSTWPPFVTDWSICVQD